MRTNLRYFLCLAIAVCLSTASVADASGHAFVPPKAVMQAMQPLLAKGLKIKTYFPGPSGWIGIAAMMAPPKSSPANPHPALRQAIYFVDPSGQYLFAGMVADLKTNRNVVRDYQEKYFPPPPTPTSPLDEVKPADLQNLNWVGEPQGNTVQGQNDLYFFVDPNCPHCRREFAAISAALHAGLIHARVRWIVITLGSPSSTTKGALILGSEHPLQVLTRIMSGKEDKMQTLKNDIRKPGGKKCLAAGAIRLGKNLAFMKSHQIYGVPLGIYLSHGTVKRIFRGFFDVSNLIKHIS